MWLPSSSEWSVAGAMRPMRPMTMVIRAYSGTKKSLGERWKGRPFIFCRICDLLSLSHGKTTSPACSYVYTSPWVSGLLLSCWDNAHNAYAHVVARIPEVLQAVEGSVDRSWAMGGGKVIQIGDGDSDFCVGTPGMRVEKVLVCPAEVAFREFKDDLLH